MVTTVTATVLVWKKHLELIVEAYADDVIGARVGLGAIGCLLVVVAVNADEVTGIEANLFIDVPCATQSDAVTVAGERGVLLITVAEAVVRALAPATDGEAVVDVVLHTSEELMGAVGEFFLTVATHTGVLIVEEVVLDGSAELVGEFIAGSNREQGRHVVAGTDAVLIWALEDDTIKAVVCSRGGYGSIHLLNRIPAEKFQQHPKWIIGHGDIAILLYAIAGANVMSIHGPMAFQIASSQEPATSITRNILFGTLPQYKIPANPYNRIGHAEGILIGGNLSSISAIAGSRFHLPSKQNVILFIEEVEESLHSIDRLFYSLSLKLNFENVKGIIFGTFNSVRYDLQYGSVEQMLIAHLHNYEIPVCCGFPVGSNSCIPLIEGALCSLDVRGDSATLTYRIKGSVEPYEVDIDTPQLLKEKQL